MAHVKSLVGAILLISLAIVATTVESASAPTVSRGANKKLSRPMLSPAVSRFYRAIKNGASVFYSISKQLSIFRILCYALLKLYFPHVNTRSI